MNYFGHAAIAESWPESTSPFVFGAMLPDLAHFVEARVSSSLPGAVGEGVRFHLQTDAVFHESPLFDEWHHRALGELRELGVGRGPARAAAHVGIEMLIDDALAREGKARDAYARALEFGAARSSELLPDSGTALAEVCTRLLRFVDQLGEPSPSRLELRIFRALAGRPKLRPHAEELRTIVAVLSKRREAVEDASSVLKESLLAGLTARATAR